MAAYTEQLDWKAEYTDRSYRQSRRSWKWHKQQMHRLMRRLAKSDPEDAPTRRQTSGWYS